MKRNAREFAGVEADDAGMEAGRLRERSGTRRGADEESATASHANERH